MKKWSESTLMIEMMKYKTRKEFYSASRSAYFTTVSNHRFMIDVYFGKPYRWTEHDVIMEALNYQTITDFQNGNWSAYKLSLKKFPHVLEHLFDSKKTFWTTEMVVTALQGFSDRAVFKKHRKNAYQYAVKNCPEVLDAHLNPTRSGKDNDTLYVWKAVDQFFNSEQVYKVGITSKRLGLARIEDVAKLAGFNHCIVTIEHGLNKAHKLEKKLLKIGSNPKYTGFAGCTEFRAFTEKQLENVMNLIEEYKDGTR